MSARLLAATLLVCCGTQSLLPALELHVHNSQKKLCWQQTNCKIVTLTHKTLYCVLSEHHLPLLFAATLSCILKSLTMSGTALIAWYNCFISYENIYANHVSADSQQSLALSVVRRLGMCCAFSMPAHTASCIVDGLHRPARSCFSSVMCWCMTHHTSVNT